MNKLIFIALAFNVILIGAARAQQVLGSCDSAVYEKRSLEIQAIAKADQEDRQTMPLTAAVHLRDLKHRMRVGEIFGEGCLKSPADFAAAALVFQHGSVPEHFLQTFYWSKRAVELGDTKQKRMMGLGLDRYLVNTGQKQLFASQASKHNNTGDCWCLEPVERSFPDSKRQEYTERTLADAFKWVDELNKGTTCPSAIECTTDLRPSPASTVVGFW